MGRWKKFKASLILCYKSRDAGFTASDNWPINGLRSPGSAGVTSPRIDNQLPTVTHCHECDFVRKQAPNIHDNVEHKPTGANIISVIMLQGGSLVEEIENCFHPVTRLDSVRFWPMRVQKSFHFNQSQASLLSPDYSVFVSHEAWPQMWL